MISLRGLIRHITGFSQVQNGLVTIIIEKTSQKLEVFLKAVNIFFIENFFFEEFNFPGRRTFFWFLDVCTTEPA